MRIHVCVVRYVSLFIDMVVSTHMYVLYAWCLYVCKCVLIHGRRHIHVCLYIWCYISWDMYVWLFVYTCKNVLRNLCVPMLYINRLWVCVYKASYVWQSLYVVFIWYCMIMYGCDHIYIYIYSFNSSCISLFICIWHCCFYIGVFAEHICLFMCIYVFWFEWYALLTYVRKCPQRCACVYMVCSYIYVLLYRWLCSHMVGFVCMLILHVYMLLC